MAILWIHSEVIHPATMTIAADHDAPTENASGSRHKEFGRRIPKTLANVILGIIPGAGQITVAPKLHQSFLIKNLKLPDLDC